MKKLIVIFAIGLCFISAGCAEKEIEKNIAAKEAQEPSNMHTSDLRKEAEDLIDKSHLSDLQKRRLKELRASAIQQFNSLNDESLRLRSVLIKDVLSPKYSKMEVMYVQDQLRKNEDARLSVILDTVDKANGILGRETNQDESERLMDQMLLIQEH